MLLVAATVIAASLGLIQAAVARQERLLAPSEALALADAAYTKRVHSLPGFSIEVDRETAHFYFFYATWNNPQPGSMMAGFVAVDKATADVWDPVMACQEIKSATLSQRQRATRASMGLSATAYKKLRRTCPLEMNESQGT